MSNEPRGTDPGARSSGDKPTEPADRPPLAEPLRPPDDPLRHSRTSGAWVALAALGIVLVLMIVFVAQNTQSVEITFFGWQGELPLAVAMMIAAVAGLFVAVIAGTLRILQLRRRVRRLKKENAQS